MNIPRNSPGRQLVDLRLRLAELLPRVGSLLPYELVGLPRREIAPVADQILRRAGVAPLASAAGVSLLTGPELSGNSNQIMLAKRVTVQLACEAGISARELRWYFAVDPSTIWRWRRPAVDAHILRAVRVRVALEKQVATS